MNCGRMSLLKRLCAACEQQNRSENESEHLLHDLGSHSGLVARPDWDARLLVRESGCWFKTRGAHDWVRQKNAPRSDFDVGAGRDHTS